MIAEEPFGALDRHFAGLINRLAERPSPELELAALLLSRHRTNGNICLPLQEIAGQALEEALPGGERLPKAAAWTRTLRASGMVGSPGEFKPLILDQQGRLYLRRYWEYETDLAEAIKARLARAAPEVDLELLQQGLDRLFPPSREKDWQRVAAAQAVTRNFTVITGGPGTGKTRTVVAILALLLEQSSKPLRLALAAPSGKAAARLKESVQKVKESLPVSKEIKARLPEEAATIHRLLGTLPDSPYFRFNADHPLLVDAVIVDEASMADLALMAKLFAAIAPAARVILLGDKDQLTSVEAGYVLGDICNPLPTSTPSDPSPQLALSFSGEGKARPIQEAIVELRKNYRFPSTSGIYRLVEAINRGDADAAIGVLRDKSQRDVTWKELASARALPKALAEAATNGYQSYLETNEPIEALARFASFRVLCAVRRGPMGVTQLNRAIEEALSLAGLLPEIESWYRGRPVMVTRNDYNTKLFNGDIGIALPDPEAENDRRVFFPSSDGGIRRVLPSRLPVHETAFAMTVHKSQGSEFSRVLLILPEKDSPVLTRELLYTGLTRARAEIEIWSSEQVLRAAIGKQVRRSSGLRDALWEDR